jgi:hypothetical protein
VNEIINTNFRLLFTQWNYNCHTVKSHLFSVWRPNGQKFCSPIRSSQVHQRRWRRERSACSCPGPRRRGWPSPSFSVFSPQLGPRLSTLSKSATGKGNSSRMAFNGFCRSCRRLSNCVPVFKRPISHLRDRRIQRGRVEITPRSAPHPPLLRQTLFCICLSALGVSA